MNEMPAGFRAQLETRNQKLDTGRGHLAAALVAGASTLTTVYATTPLKLLTPVGRGPAAWVYGGTFGGGLLAGDAIALNATIESGATLVLATQASTKVYRSDNGLTASQTLHATVAEDGLLISVPDHVTPFAGARFAQRTRCQLAAGGSVVLLDWLSAGRSARDESWVWHQVDSRLQVDTPAGTLLEDRLLLTGADLPQRMGRFHCYGTLIVVGPRVRELAAGLLAAEATRTLTPSSRLLTAVSPLADGCVLRFAAVAVEPAQHFLRATLAPLATILDDPRWHRRWA